MIGSLSQDLRFAMRALTKRPGFTATIVLTLALGIGASSAAFSVVYGVLLKPLPYDEPDRLVSVSHRGSLVNGTGFWNHGPATWFAAYDNQTSFEAVGSWDRTEISVTGLGDPEHVRALSVGHTTLPLLRVRPHIGRFFIEEDDRPETPMRVVLTHGYWQRRFGGAANAIGSTLDVNGARAEIIGVAPPSFRFPWSDPAILLPLKPSRAVTGIQFGFQAIGRLKPGTTLAQAEADQARWLTTLLPRFERIQLRPNIRPLSEYARGDAGRVLWILLAAAGVVLLIACSNVANLFLVRAEGRQQEFAMRAALGASGRRLARALLSESVLLALAGGAVGLALAVAAIRVLRAIAPADLPRVEEIAIDPTVLAFTVSVSILSGLLFGLVAVLRFARPSVMSLRDGGRSASAAPGRHRARNFLVVAQVALALMLLVVSGLMIRTFMAMRGVDPGFTNANQVQTFSLSMPSRVVQENEQVVRTYDAITARLAQVPGVTSVGLASSITMDGEDNGNYIAMEGDPEPSRWPLRRFKSVGPGYFETMGIRLVAGRSVTWQEILDRRMVVLISAATARQFWPDPVMALGKRLNTGDGTPWREIIGVVADERDDGVTKAPTTIVYWPMWNESYRWRTMSFAVRSSRVGTPGFLGELQQAVWSVNRNLPLSAIETLEEIRDRSMSQTSFAMIVLVIAAGVALVLGVVGIYSVLAYVAAERTREIGIRIALGARVSHVRALFLRRGLALTGIGIAVGLAAAMLLTRVMSAMLFGVVPTDPATYLTVSALLAFVGLVATYLPALRASRVDPIIALRSEL
jgi:putative ABC transport system permease protein